MKVFLWIFVLLSLIVPIRSDCHHTCLTCSRLLHHQQPPFNIMVCLLECEAQTLAAGTLDLCYNELEQDQTSISVELLKRPEDIEEPQTLLNVRDDGVEYFEALEQFQNVARELGTQPSEDLQRVNEPKLSYDQLSSQTDNKELENDMDAEEEQDQERDSRVTFSKRFGGFTKGRHGFRKLVSSGRPLQKRYGGFIGIRKSARKWNNQKRVSQLLRQYLSLSARMGRSGRFTDLSARPLWQRNWV